MKLCIVTHKVKKGDGQGRVNYEITTEAIRRDYTVTLLATEIAPELQNHQKIDWIPIPIKRIPTALLKNLAFSRQSAHWLRQHRHQFDLVKINGAITTVSADVNAVHFVHHSWLNSSGHSWQQQKNWYSLYQWCYTALNAYLEKRAFQQAKVVVAVSQKVAQDLLSVGVSPEQIRVILNGVDLQEFSPGKVERQKLGLPEKVSLALFVGDLRTSRKNLDTILQALVLTPNLYLAVVGTTQGSPYPRLADRLGLGKRVQFLGYRRDVAEIMKAVDFFVFPSRYEACTLVLLEAMASGLPVITAASAGGAELVTPDCGIVLSNSEDVLGLSKALEQLQRDRALRERLGRAARTIAEQHSWRTKAQQYIDCFETLSQIALSSP
jgi:glycosyltransferase involved in cell wall biosynthesis